jgi:uncharacterized membrane protein (DUF485 family)
MRWRAVQSPCASADHRRLRGAAAVAPQQARPACGVLIEIKSMDAPRQTLVSATIGEWPACMRRCSIGARGVGSPTPLRRFREDCTMDMRARTVDWAAVNDDPRFRALTREKTRFLWGLMLFSVAYYFMLPIGAAYFTELFKTRLWGPINVGLAFAWSEFVVAWAIAFVYARRANARFDALAAEINRDALARVVPRGDRP